MMPTQFGPMMRMRCGLAASSIACCSEWPRSPSSAKPAVMITAARVPRSPSSPIKEGTVSAGIAMTAMSGARGRLAIFGWTMSPSIVVCFGLTSIISPAKPARRRLRAITAPTEPGRGLAPINATDSGLNSLSRLRIDIGLYIALSPAGVRRELCLNGDSQSQDQIVNGMTECGQLRVVGFGDIDFEPLAESSNQIEEIHRVDIELLAQFSVRIEPAGVGLGRNPAELIDQRGS